MSEQATTDRLHEIIRDTLWHRYGYWIACEDAHPATHRRVNEDAEAIIEAIEQAGYALIERGRWERVRQSAHLLQEASVDAYAANRMIRAEGTSLAVDRDAWERLAREALARLIPLEPGDLAPIGGER